MRKLNCAVIGCGRIGCGFDDNPGKIIKTHAGAYFKNPQTNLVALCDVDKKKLKKYSKKYHISKTYTNSEELFKNEKLDCVSICTLVETHLDLIKKAAISGVKGIFLEKPIAENLRDAKEIIKICNKYNIILQIDHQRRFHSIYKQIKKMLSEKKMCNIQLVNVYYGAGIANTGSHMFDILRMLFGEIESVHGKFSQNLSENHADPNLDIALRFQNSIQCQIHSLSYRKYALFQIEIFGSEKKLEIDLIKNEVKQFEISKKSMVYKTLVPGKIFKQNLKKTPIQNGLQNLIDSIQLNKENMSTGNDGLKSLEIIIAVIKSAKLNKIIYLPIKNFNYKISSK